MKSTSILAAVVSLFVCTATPSLAATRRVISRAEYAKQLQGMWLGETIANWTGLQTEGVRAKPPFFTSRDWGTVHSDIVERGKNWAPLEKKLGGSPDKIDWVVLDPWLSDDDTDIEYIYTHLMVKHRTPLLSPEQIVEGWTGGIYAREDDDEAVWLADRKAVHAMRRGILPPATGLSAVTTGPDPYMWEEYPTRILPQYLMISAQVSTELFGAIAPGMPAYALRIGDLPVRNVSGSYASHAAQVYQVLYSLAPVVDPALSSYAKVLWLATEARKYIPSTSKTADILDTVLAQFLRDCPRAGAPGCANWERARDLIYSRYHLNAAANGFKYVDWWESSVNIGTGIMCLLYGQGDFKRTVQIGALSGWDSDNGTATMGGLLGLMNGYDWVVAQFPGVRLSDRYSIWNTRNPRYLPDHLPNDSQAEDTFAMLAQRTLSVVDIAVREGGGTVRGSTYELPALPSSNELAMSPTERLQKSSANMPVRAEGGSVGATSSSNDPGAEALADGAEHDFRGHEPKAFPREYRAQGKQLTFSVVYDRDVELRTLRFMEGSHNGNHGQFRSVVPEALVGGRWVGLASARASGSLSARPNQIIDWVLPQTLLVRGIRLRGETLAGSATIIELDAMAE